MKKIKFVRFDWAPSNEVQELDTQINNFLRKHPKYKVLNYKFTAFYNPYYSAPAEAALIEFEVLNDDDNRRTRKETRKNQ